MRTIWYALPHRIDEVGALVWFASARSMTQVRMQLPAHLAADVQVQSSPPTQDILLLHRAAVDAGRRSIIFGHASFGEGVDLPGAYCRVVLISKPLLP